MSPEPGNIVRTAGRALVDQLVLNGVDTVFCVPGESYLDVLDGLWQHRDRIRTVQCRHEAAAANMAAAIGKLTGRPGVCMVTRGPGATHAATGIHTARQDSTPMLLFIGQVARDARDREAFQEIDYRAMFGSIAKWVAEVDDPMRMPEYIQRAFATAMSGRPGPVVISLPEDMLSRPCPSADSLPAVATRPGVSPASIQELADLLERACAPLAILGGGGWTPEACAAVARYAEQSGLPVAAAFRSQDLVDNDQPCYIGHLGVAADRELIETVRHSDLILAVGTRLEETVSQGYTLFDIPSGPQTLVHVHPDPEELGRVYRPALGICAGMPELAEAMARLPIAPGRWASRTAVARARYEESQRPGPCPGELDLGAVMIWLRERLPADAIIANGAGNYAIWVHRFLRWHRPNTQLAPSSGAMGYGVPAAIAAKLRYPERTVIAFAGDGCFLMAGQELATAVQHGAAIIVIVVNNGMYGTIRMHQERSYPGHVSATELQNPDFAAYARAFRCYGETVLRTADFAPAFERALLREHPSLIELVIDPEASTPGQTLSGIRAAAVRS